MKRTPALILALVSIFATANALEPRTWVIMDGRTIEGTLVKTQGNAVVILDKDSKQLQLDKSWLSIGDNDYVKEFAPDSKGGFSTAQAVALPVPAKMAKVDTKLFKKNAGTISIPNATFDILETPHFKVMYMKGGAADDMGELAERMWVDGAFFYGDFLQKFSKDKMAIFIAPDDSIYDGIGSWYAELLAKSGNQEAANRVKATWPRSAAGSMTLPVDTARDNGLLQHARVFRGYRKTSADGKRTEAIKGVWVPFYVHCLAGDMLDIQAGGVSNFGAKGWFAVEAGHSYYKEIGLTGKSETNMLGARSISGNDVSTSGGFKDSRNWASELKKIVRKGEIKPTFDFLYGLEVTSADEKSIALVYGFARYLQSNLSRLSAYSKLTQRISTSRQMPDAESLAKIYGFDSAAAMEADFLKYLTGTEFR